LCELLDIYTIGTPSASDMLALSKTGRRNGR
jgi:hypothetical protein